MTNNTEQINIESLIKFPVKYDKFSGNVYDADNKIVAFHRTDLMVTENEQRGQFIADALNNTEKLKAENEKLKDATVWIARDGSGLIYQYGEVPLCNKRLEIFRPFEYPCHKLDKNFLPDIKPGECFRAEIVLKEKVR